MATAYIKTADGKIKQLTFTSSKKKKQTKARLSSRECAVYRNIWELTVYEKQKLDRCANEILPFSTFEATVIQTDAVKDYLKYGGYLFEVVYLMCNLDTLEAGKQVVCSFRQNYATPFAVVVVRSPIANNAAAVLAQSSGSNK